MLVSEQLQCCLCIRKILFWGDWIRNSFWATLPVSCISFAYRYAEPNSYFPIFLIQLGIFILTSDMIYKYFSRIK